VRYKFYGGKLEFHTVAHEAASHTIAFNIAFGIVYTINAVVYKPRFMVSSLAHSLRRFSTIAAIAAE
jgi:hypothetical protein